MAIPFFIPSHPTGARLRWAASVLSGLLLVACFPKLGWSALVWVACAPLFMALATESRLRRGFALGYVAGAVFLAGSCYWFVNVMEHYGRLPGVLAWGALLLFVIVFSLFFGVFGLVESWAAQTSPATALALAPFLWVTLEVARTYLITGFPWNLLGYAVQAIGLRQVASVTAVYGLSFLAAATSALVAWALLRPEARRAAVALGVVCVGLAVGNLLLTPPIPVAESNLALLVQPDIPLEEPAADEWAPWRNAAPLNRLVELSLSAALGARAAETPHPDQAPASRRGETLIVWAENPAPFFFTRDPVFRTAVEQMARQAQACVVVNTVNPVTPDGSQVTNSAVLLGPDGRALMQYDKIHLVPFGEYVPAWAFPGLIGKITSEVGSYVPGSSVKVATTPGGTVGVFICYEAIFPQLVRRVAAAGAEVLVNISNDAWYGDTAAPWQHLEMARLRAIENHRYLLRATNDGLTVIIDPYGRVTEQIPRHREMVLAGHFGFLARETFYTRHGDVFAWFCVAVAALMAGWQLARRSRQKAAGSRQ